MSLGQDGLLIVYPQAGNAFYEVLARRLLVAREERSEKATLCSASAVCGMEPGNLNGKTVAVIAPAQCYAKLPNRNDFSERLIEAKKRIMILAESVETVWFKNQFQVPVSFDALIDIGFVSQKPKLNDFELSYLFLFNGPTREERRIVERASTNRRPISWATVGHDRGERVELAQDLVHKLDPGGVVFLPPSGVIIRKEKGLIGPESLHRLLCRTRYYVWRTHHDFDYYESFRFREAILAGAVPCKIGSRGASGAAGVPSIFPSIETFVDAVDSDGFEALQDSAREYYLSQGFLADQFEEILENV